MGCCNGGQLEQSVFIFVKKKTTLFRNGADGAVPKLHCTLDMTRRKRKRKRCLAGIDRLRVAAIGQLFQYMVHYELGFRALTSADVTFFVKRTPGNSLLISKGFSWSDGEHLPTLSFVLQCATGETRKPPRCNTRSSLSLSRSSKSLCWRNELFGPRNYIHAEELHLERSAFARGWSGHIVKGVYENKFIAVKLAPLHSMRGNALMNETLAYYLLEKLWGVHVATLVKCGMTADDVVFIATELVNGCELGTEPVTEKVARAAIQALKAVHAANMIHGDIRESNILVMDGGLGGVRLIDFGFARFATSAEELVGILAGLMDNKVMVDY